MTYCTLAAHPSQRRPRNGITPVDPDAIEGRARAAKYRPYDDIFIG